MATSREIRARLDHPVIDADGHTVEYEPAVNDYLRQVAGADTARRMRPSGSFGWYGQSPEERFARRTMRPPWWALPARNTLDRATAMLPELLYGRLDETGIDFAVLYPTNGLFAVGYPEAELRQAMCRAYNAYHADVFAPFADRLCPVAIIPMHTPEEALAELDAAVAQGGMKAIMMAGIVTRPLPAALRDAPQAARLATWVDHLGVDSAYDYDPVWQRCRELQVSPTFHSGAMGWGSRTSPTNYMYNHIGHFAAAGHATCKSLFMAGVTRRFPELRFAFLEAGVAWASNLYNDLIGHWEKRNATSVRTYDPTELDVDLLERLFREHGRGVVDGREDGLRAALEKLAVSREDEAAVDEWAPIGVERATDLRDRFVDSFFFGCEADDPMNAMAFDTRVNAFGARLRAIFSSDIGHWDVPDIAGVLEEAHELVEHGNLSDDDFRDFVFTNATHLYGDVNPAFFDGTVVAGACTAELGAVTTG